MRGSWLIFALMWLLWAAVCLGGPVTQVAITSGSNSITAGACSGATAYVFTSVDGGATPTNAASDIYLFPTLKGTGLGGIYQSDCRSPVRFAKIASGAQTLTVYVKATKAGSLILATNPYGYTSDSLAITVAAAAFTKLGITPGISSLESAYCNNLNLFRVVAKDANGNALNVGSDTTVSVTASNGVTLAGFSAANGTSCSSAVDLSNLTITNGSSSVSFYLKATHASVRSFTVTAASAGKTSASVLLVLSPATLIPTPALVSYNYLRASQTLATTFSDTHFGAGAGLTFACVFDRIIDGVVSPGTACTSLPGTATFNTGTGAFSWTPDGSAVGPYEIKVSSTPNNASYVFVVRVPATYTTAKLRGDWDAFFATGTGPNTNSNATWTDLTSNHFDGITGRPEWIGNGSAGNPYAHRFNGASTSKIDFTTSPLSGQTKTMFTSWISPASVSSADKVIFGNSAGVTGNGITVRQSKSQSGKLEFVIGSSYQDEILADNPVLYWRLGDGSGTTAYDASVNHTSGAYSGTPSWATGALTGDSDSAAVFNGARYVNLASNSNFNFDSGDSYTLEAWVKTAAAGAIISKMILGGTYRGYFLYSCGTDTAGYCANHGLACVLVSDYATQNGIGVHSDGSSPINDGNWHHVACTYDGSSAYAGFKLYIDGVAQSLTNNSDVSGLAGVSQGTAPLQVGARSGGTFLTGSLDEVAIYSSKLSAAQITRHYNAGVGTYGGSCRSTSSFTDSMWDFVAGLYDGTNAKLFVNGRQECTVGVSAGFTSPATGLFAGATSTGTKAWSGSLSDLKIYGTSDGSAVGTAASIKANFDATADKFRTNPVGNIVSGNLLVLFDAANASRGLAFPGSGGSNTWVDLSSSALDGTLHNFNNTPSSGWNGDGSTGHPYELTFDGNDDGVSLGSMVMPDSFTLEAWVRTTGLTLQPIFSVRATGLIVFDAYLGHFFEYHNNGLQMTSTGFINDNQWHHVAMTCDPVALGKMYIDGALDSSANGDCPTSTSLAWIGYDPGNPTYLHGSLAKVALYNRDLSLSEISQNCKAMQSRFSGFTCN